MKIKLIKSPPSRFKINPSYDLDWTPIYTTKIEDGALGKGNKNGTILISDELHPKDVESIVDHEKVHIDQMKRGDLDYDDDCVYWKGKCWKRSEMDEGNPHLPWEKEAYDKTDDYESL
jgi:hypothetical protein|tara:strand:- start:1184 stop:1537 length:354 start_codon:yes stop_codon:yes gene_type:complete